MNFRNPSYRFDEEALVARAANGDLDAFNQLVLEHQDLAYRHAYSLLADPAAAEDATQESFIKAFHAVHSFRGGSFRSWLLRIVSNTAYDVLRQSKRRPTQPLYPESDDGEEVESPAWLADPNASVHGTVEQHEEAKRLYQMLDELPEAYRSVLTLIDLYELDYAEAARALKVPIGTVKSRLARARMQMQEKLLTEKYAILPIGRGVRSAGQDFVKAKAR
jgi:RNA polymerase sigma-70 factor (ECF subfamily)